MSQSLNQPAFRFSMPLPDEGELQPITFRRLIQFDNRNRQLSWWHGLSMVAAVLVGSLALAVLLDAWVVSPWARWSGSLLMYGCVLAALYWFCLRPWRRPRQLMNIARQFERRDYRLRDKLLSAVELSRGDEETSGDSGAFRAQLQLQVAQVISPVDPKRLLPWTMVRRSLILGIVAVCGLVIAGCIPGLRLPHRAARILLPAADLGRVTSIAIRILSPLPASRTVPAGEIVAIQAGIEGPRPAEVWLECNQAGEQRRMLMSPLPSPLGESIKPDSSRYDSEAQFQITILADEDQINYRVVSSGASTPWHRLVTRERPKATHFQAVISPPSYTGLGAATLESSDGDIDALVGSQVELRISVNQPIAVAELRWRPDSTLNPDGSQESFPSHDADNAHRNSAQAGDKSSRQDLASAASSPQAASSESKPSPMAAPLKLRWDAEHQVLVGAFPIEASASYRLFLQNRETGFTNEFSPSYRVSAIEDAPPMVEWTRPELNSLIAPPTEVLSLGVAVKDELPAATLTQFVRVDSAVRVDSLEWNERKLVEDVLGAHSWEFDLMPFLLDAGDVIETKVVARDRRGSIGESETLKIQISSTSIELAASESELRRFRIASHLDALLETVSELASQIATAAQHDSTERNGLLRLLSEKLDTGARSIIEELKNGASQETNALNALELRLVAESLAILVTEQSNQLMEAQNREHEVATELAERVQSQVKGLATQLRTLASHDVFRRHSEQLAKVLSAEQELAAAPELSMQQMRRRQDILLRQMKDVQQSMLDSIDAVRQDSQAGLRRGAENLGNLIDQTERKNSSSDVAFLGDLALSTANSLQTSSLISRMDGGLPEAVRKARQELVQSLAPVHQPIANLASSDQDAALSKAKLQPALDLLALRRTILRAAGGGSQVLASDVGTARRALEAWFNASAESTERTTQLQGISQSLQTLVVAHELHVAAAQLQSLLRGERWNFDATDTRVESPRVWDAFTIQIATAAELAGSAVLPKSLTQRIDRLRWEPSAKEAARRIASRLWDASRPVSATNQLAEVSRGLQDVQRELAPYVAQARGLLAAQAPSLAELAQRAANKTAELSEDTQSLADAVRRDEVPDNQVRVEQLQNQLTQLADPIEELREALVDQADAQDLLVAEQRELARQADAAIEVVDRAEQQAIQSLDEIPLNPGNGNPGNGNAGDESAAKETAEQLELSAQQQAGAAAALEQLARLLQQLPADSPQSTASTSGQSKSPQQVAEEIEQLAKQMDDSFQSLESQAQYDQAEQLSQLGEASPEEILRQLEQQLKSNRPMREEMSDIARAAAEQALESLEQAGRRQAQIIPDLEDSDATFKSRKRLLVHDLQSVRENAFQSLGLLLSEAKWTAGAAREASEEQLIKQADSQLQSALQLSGEINLLRPFGELKEKALALHAALVSIQEQLTTSGARLTESGSQQFHQNGADLNNRRREMKDRQRRVQQQHVRNLQQSERTQLQLLGQAEKDFQTSSELVNKLQQEQAQLQTQLEQANDDSGLPRQLAATREQLELAERVANAEKYLRDALKHRVERVQPLLQQANNRTLPPLDGSHPTAQLSGSLAHLVAERGAELADCLSDWTGPKSLGSRASREGLEASLAEQDAILREVEMAAEHLARASRHEVRLDHTSTSTQLEKLSGMVREIGAFDVRTAQAALMRAEAETAATGSKTAQASAESTAQAISCSELASSAIEHAANVLRTLLDSPTEAQPAGQPVGTQPSPPSTAQGDEQTPPPDAASVLDPKEMAQMLDELDRMLLSDLNLGPQEDNAEGRPGDAKNADGQAGESSDSLPNTLTEAAKQLASQMSQSREPLPPEANPDLGMATESQLANVEPQGPATVRILDVSRLGGDWGRLQERAAEGTVASQLESLAPRFRAQVEAYFRSLSIESQRSER